MAYVHSERFVSDMVRALQHNKMNDFKTAYRSLDALLIDDIQFFAGKDRSQEEFFHTFNALLEGQQQIILTCDRYPKEVDGLEERLKSRFGWGLHRRDRAAGSRDVRGDPDEQGAGAGVELPEEVAFFMAKRIRSNVRELEGALRRVIANARFTGQPDHARIREGSASRPAVTAGEADHDREHPEDRRRLLQSPHGGSAVEAAQSLGRATASGRDGTREGIDEPQPARNRRRFRRPRSHDRAARLQAHQGAARGEQRVDGGLLQPVENPGRMMWTSL